MGRRDTEGSHMIRQPGATRGLLHRVILALGCCAALAAIALAEAAPATPPPYKKDAGPQKVETAVYDWVDGARNRTVPVRVYYPASGDGPLPLIVFSHGLGGSRDGYEYLGRHWAGHGYVSVHLQHKGSDAEVWRGKANPMESMREAVLDVRNALDRPLDVHFAVDQVLRLNHEEGPLKGRIDFDRLGIAGHSFGAHTALAVAGLTTGGGEPRLADPRFKAAIAMSAPAPVRRDRLDAPYARIRIPCLHMTGTEDSSPIGDTRPEDRRIPFDHIRAADQYLVTFAGGDHMVFSGRRWRGGDAAKDPLFHDLIRQSTTAFWDAYLKDDPAARAWLAGGGFSAVLGKDGVFEKKLAAETAAPTVAGPK